MLNQFTAITGVPAEVLTAVFTVVAFLFGLFRKKPGSN
jgi:hypothetical protein